MAGPPAHGLAVLRRPRGLRAHGAAHGRGPVHRHRGRPRLPRAHARRRPGRRGRDRAAARAGLRQRSRRLRRAGRVRGRARVDLDARLSRAAHLALLAARRRAGGPGRLARDRVDAGRQGRGAAPGRCVPGSARPGGELRRDGRGLRGWADRVSGTRLTPARSGARENDVCRREPARGTRHRVGKLDRAGGAAGDDRDEHAVLPVPAHAARVRPRRPRGRPDRARRAGRGRGLRLAPRGAGDRVGAERPRLPHGLRRIGAGGAGAAHRALRLALARSQRRAALPHGPGRIRGSPRCRPRSCSCPCPTGCAAA